VLESRALYLAYENPQRAEIISALPFFLCMFVCVSILLNIHGNAHKRVKCNSNKLI